MKHYTRKTLRLPAQTTPGKPGVVLKPGEYLPLHLVIPRLSYPVRHRLRVVGETDVFWRWRCEQGMPFLYRSIADALDNNDVPGEKYSLHLSGKGETWPRNAFMRLRVDHHVSGPDLTFHVVVRSRNLQVDDGGEVVVELGCYQRKSGRHVDDVYAPPDRRVTLAIPHGTCGWRSLTSKIRLPQDTVTIVVRVGGTAFRGDVWLGTPRLMGADGETLIPPFMPDNVHWPHMNWLGENLSRFESPEFDIAVDGQRIFKGPAFNSIYRDTDFEVPLPELSAGRHRVIVKHTGDYATALPFVVKRAELLGESARPVEVVAFPEYACEGRTFPVLLERRRGSGARLEVVHLPAGAARPSPRYTVTAGDFRETIRLRRVVRHDEEEITLSTGDAIYIPQTPEAFTRYIAWYLANRIGNAICFRPVYRWSGSRTLNPAAWRAAVDLLRRLRMPYNIMRDGREFPGKSANPPLPLVRGPGFMGLQAHELDGAFCYGGGGREDGLMTDIILGYTPPGYNKAIRPAMREGYQVVGRYDRLAATNMKEAAELFMRCIADSRGPCTRHTGPSTLFRYFLKAGYDWVGAEQMYGPEDVILASLRGACRAAGKQDYGAHLAMQWSSGPQDSPRHTERYFLSLATCYLQGVNNINLEEGLWRIEEDFAHSDRFSRACAIHREAHQRFFRFLQTHPRRGVLRIPFAALQGRYCGWRSFLKDGGWRSDRPDFRLGPPEESFDLLRVFYPRSRLEAIYRFPCPENKPQGWYSGTPFGPIDLLPVEAPLRVFKDYRAIAFLGWNTFDEQEFRRLLAWVEEGGVLLLARPHISTNLKRFEPSQVPRSETLRRLIGSAGLAAHRRQVRRVGRGRVIFFPQDAYPSESAIQSAYEQDLGDLAAEAVQAERQRGWIRGSPDVNFAAYDWAAGRLRTIYLLNIDWWSGQPARTVALQLGARDFPVRVRAGRIETITVADRIAVMPETEDVDVLDIETAGKRTLVRVQSDGPSHLRVFRADGVAAVPFRIAIPGEGVADIPLP